jgi:hypothetical protein
MPIATSKSSSSENLEQLVARVVVEDLEQRLGRVAVRWERGARHHRRDLAPDDRVSRTSAR